MTRAKEQENMKDIRWEDSQQGNERRGNAVGTPWDELNRLYAQRIGLLEKANKVRSTTNTTRDTKERGDL